MADVWIKFSFIYINLDIGASPEGRYEKGRLFGSDPFGTTQGGRRAADAPPRPVGRRYGFSLLK